MSPLTAFDGVWGVREAQHLLNRAGFGVPRDLARRLAEMSPQQAVSCLLDYEQVYDRFRPPDFLVEPLGPKAVEHITAGMSEGDIRKLSDAGQAFERENLGLLQGWWLHQILTTTRPLREKMTLFWHGHFATSAQKVEEPWRNYQLNAVFREHAVGNFKSLTLAVGRSPAMLQYLDNIDNVKGRPNENWARELLELFTLGHGHYTEDDIKNAARGFTGWTANHTGYVFDPERHDWGPKRFLGRTGNFDGRDIVDIVFEQPQTARFISEKLYRYFVSEDVNVEIVEALAQTLRENDYELKPMLRQLFLSRAFYGEPAIGSQVKSPVQLLVSLSYDLNFEVAPLTMMDQALQNLGQRLFYPPSVKGWDGGRAWINANTLTLRYNLPVAMVMASVERDDAVSKAMESKGEMSSSMMMGVTKLDPAMDITGTIGALMDAVPRKHREEVAKIIGLDSPEYRRFLRTFVVQWQNRATWSSRRVFDGIAFETAGGCTDALESRYLSVPLSSEHRKVLVRALGSQDEWDVLRRGEVGEQQMNQTLHLFFSLAEYQLC